MIAAGLILMAVIIALAIVAAVRADRRDQDQEEKQFETFMRGLWGRDTDER